MVGAMNMHRQPKAKFLATRHSAMRSEPSASESQQPSDSSGSSRGDKIWEALNNRLNPIKEFSEKYTERSLRWSRVGLVLSVILIGMVGILEIVFLVVFLWDLFS